MAGKRISANVPEQTHPEVTNRAAGPEPTGGICDSGEDTSIEDQRWFEDMAILRRAAAELAERRTAAKSSAPWLARDDSFYGFVEALGLVSDAIKTLIGEGGKDSYSAFSLLFLAAKAGEIQPLVRAIENHPSVELRQKLIGLLASSGENESLPSSRRLPVAKTLPWNCV